MPHRQSLRAVLSLLLVFTLAGCQNRAPVDRIAHVENGLRPRGAGLLDAPKHLTDRLAYYKIPAVSVAVVDGGRVVWARGYGTLEPGAGAAVDEHTLFHGASLSKTVNALTVLKFVADGKLDLDEDVNDDLASWQVPVGKFNQGHKTTLREILSHTAGFNIPLIGLGSPAAGPVPTLKQFLEGKHPATNPAVAITYPLNGVFHYSGGGIAVTQQLLVDVANQPYEKLVQDTVFGPLGMTDSTFDQPLPSDWAARAAPGFAKGKRVNGPERVYPAMSGAGIWTTPRDMAQVILEIQRAASGEPGKVLTPAMAKEMLTGRAAYPRSVVPTQVGLGVFVNGKGDSATFFHAGSHAGYRCYMVGTVRTGKGVVVMTNAETGFDLIGEIVTAVAKEYGWTDYHFVPPPPAPTTAPSSQPVGR
jgi:CubicO group peptidase (beta-lactamase class C family)